MNSIKYLGVICYMINIIFTHRLKRNRKMLKNVAKFRHYCLSLLIAVYFRLVFVLIFFMQVLHERQFLNRSLSNSIFFTIKIFRLPHQLVRCQHFFVH